MNNQNKKKKPASNPFSCFLIDFQIQQEQKGIFYSTVPEASKAAEPFWIKLSQEEKDHYKEKANYEKRDSKYSVSKLTSQGVPIEEMERQKRELKEKHRQMQQKIEEELTNAAVNGTLEDLQFNLISTTDFCQTLDGDIFPAEIALCKFSLRQGIIDSIHMLINPGILPLGFLASAQDKSDAYHKLKIPPNAEGISNYFKIFKRITDFLDNGGSKNFPFVYTQSEFLNSVRLTIQKCLTETENYSDIQIWPIEEFFGPLKKRTMEIKGKLVPAECHKLVVADVIQRDPYAYTMGIGCEIHDRYDQSIHCNLSQVKRWAFSVIDYCLPDLKNIKFIKGKHMPDDDDLKIPDCFDVDDGHLIDLTDDEDTKTITPDSSISSRSPQNSFTEISDVLNSSFMSSLSSRLEEAGEKPSDEDFMSYASEDESDDVSYAAKWKKLHRAK